MGSDWNFKTMVWRLVIRLLVTLFWVLTSFFGLILPKARELPDSGIKILLTGTFYSDNWIITHLKPLSLASSVIEVRMVSSRIVPDIAGVTPIYPSARMVRVLGPTVARLFTFVRESWAWNPDIIGGFHLLLNGLVAQLLASLKSRRCMYFCGGGVREVDGGGFKTENRLFNKLRYRSSYVERLLIRSAIRFDYLITMGTSVRQYFSDFGAKDVVYVVPGGFDDEIYRPSQAGANFDVITVGRLSAVKRVEMLLEAVAVLRRQEKVVSVAIVGDGPSMAALNDLAEELDISDQIEFAGWQSDVASWLERSRVFTLTSESEGLSQAMIQAMLCGLPAVVSDVGDLKDLVVDGRNGLLVGDQTKDAFAAAFRSILCDRAYEARLAHAARQTALQLRFSEVADRWDEIFG